MNWLLDTLDVRALTTQLVAFVPELVAAALILLGFWLTYRMTHRVLAATLLRAGLHTTLVKMLVDNIYHYALLILGGVMAADQVGINVGTALAGIGVAGIAIGFAAQDTLANILAGFIIFMDKPFEVGDWVKVADHYGEISGITMRSTRIRTRRNTYVVIPNKTVIDTVLVNHSKHGATRVDVPVGIAYKENILKARQVLLDAIIETEGILKEPAPSVAITELGASSVNMEVYVWIENASMERPIYTRVLEASKLALDAAGIEIPYHHMQLFIENVEDRVWKKAAHFIGESMMKGGTSTTQTH